MKTACVIGAGAAGLAAGKALKDRNIDFDWFEKGSYVGGLWQIDNDNGGAAAYHSLHLNSSRPRTQYPSFPMPEARANRLQLDWAGYTPPIPNRLGITIFDDVDLNDIRETIDWTPFFTAWELHGKFPAILDDPVVGESARSLFADAQAMLDCIIQEKWLRAKAVVGLFPAVSEGDDITVFDPAGEVAHSPLTTIHCLRQQMQRPPGRPNLSLADYVAPADSGLTDYVGMFAVTAGLGLDEVVRRFEAAHDDYNAILAKALADRLAEALAEYMHQCVRRELWGYAPDETLDNAALINEAYRGIRPAPGYPACPDHTEKGELFRTLGATEAIGLHLTENYAMVPTAAVSGYYFAHPEARYYGLGRIDRDQVEDYAARKGMDMATAERWLASNLGY